MGGTDPFTRVSVETKPALYWPSLLKQSDVKCLAHTHKLTRTAAGTLSLKMKRNHCLFCCSVAGIEYRHWCWFLQPTTAICVYKSERRHHKTPLSYCWTHQTSPRGWMPLSACFADYRCLVGVWLFKPKPKPNDGIPVTPFRHQIFWCSASVSVSDVTLLVILCLSSIMLSSISAMLLCLCLLLSDWCCKWVLAGNVKMLSQVGYTLKLLYKQHTMIYIS